MSTPASVVIIGAGMAGFSVASSLREMGYAGRVVLLGEEPYRPYNRPPLSKAFLTGAVREPELALRPASFYESKNVEVVTGHKVVAVDRPHRRVALDDDTVIPYEHLVFAVGARNRALPVPGAQLDGVFFLRTLEDAISLRDRLPAVKRAVVIGAGFIGLEFALVALKLGVAVTVIDIANRPMARVLSPAMSAVFVREHTKEGIQFLFETQVMHIVGEGGRVSAVETVGSEFIPADLVVIGIGVQPNVEVAAASNLDIADGIVVNNQLTTSDADISAVGDCAWHPNAYAAGSGVRLESVQNANDQGRCVAAKLMGKPEHYANVPWFWSDQGQLKLQIAGYTAGCDMTVMRGQSTGPTCSVFCFRQGRFVGVETVNHTVDYMMGRRLLGSHAPLTPQEAADESFDLKAHATRHASHAWAGR
jgi:3-phenylpropionate/trans-cinnamate dioxygenase ferredoxin reductase subunit